MLKKLVLAEAILYLTSLICVSANILWVMFMLIPGHVICWCGMLGIDSDKK